MVDAYADTVVDMRDDAPSQKEGKQALSVSAAVGLAKSALEAIKVRVVGEVSWFKRYDSVTYFTVKDEHAVLQCQIWNTIFDKFGFVLSVGALVEIDGSFGVWLQKGDMKFYTTRITIAGEGELRVRIANLDRKLHAEGLYDAEKKLPIPPYPVKIGLVTSPKGAVKDDVMRTLRRRFPLAEILFAGVKVDGPQAVRGIVKALGTVVNEGGAEVVLLVRGGGSLEDLMPFNDELLARTIAKCPVPIVTGIGHEPDTSIADKVADLRASTPTAAAEAVSVGAEQLALQFDTLESRLMGSQMRSIADLSAQVQRIGSVRVFSDPMRLFENEALTLDDLSERLFTAIPDRLTAMKASMREYALRLTNLLKNATVQPVRTAELLQQRLINMGGNMLQRFDSQCALASSRLDDLSPLGVVARGYSMAKDDAGNVVSSVEQVKPDDTIHVNVSDGIIDCKVLDTQQIALSLQEI